MNGSALADRENCAFPPVPLLQSVRRARIARRGKGGQNTHSQKERTERRKTALFEKGGERMTVLHTLVIVVLVLDTICSLMLIASLAMYIKNLRKNNK